MRSIGLDSYSRFWLLLGDGGPVLTDIILTGVAREWCIYASAPTRLGPQRFIWGSICPSSPFERYRLFTSPFKRAADLQNVWRLLNTDAPVYVYRRAVFATLRWCKSEKEKKLERTGSV